jgi:hypothetical protein
MFDNTEFTNSFSSVALGSPPPEVAERIRKQPECELLWAVLENGLTDYMKYATANGRRGKRLFREAQEWIMADDPTWLCSFLNICHVLGIDPDYVRTGLRRWLDRQTLPPLKHAA